MPVQRLFLSVGAMKAATTFVFNVLTRHPGIYFTPEKELHYFAQNCGLSPELCQPLLRTPDPESLRIPFSPGDILSNEFRRHRLSMVMHNRYSRLTDAEAVREIVRWYADRYMTNPINDDWFDRVFAKAGDRYAADFSNYHALLGENGWRHAKEMCGELKVIYFLRHPVERLWSHIKFHHIQSGERSVLDNFTSDMLDDILGFGAISAHARYGDIVESLQANLTPQQLKVMAFETIRGDFFGGMGEIESFLGIASHSYAGVDPARKANSTEEIAIPADLRNRIADAVRPQLEKLTRLGVALPESYWQ
jgi:hypothetical protein